MPAKKSTPSSGDASPPPKKTATKKTAARKSPAKKAAKKSAARAVSPKPGPSTDEIARAAYLNYRRRIEQGLPGNHESDWLEAEWQLRGEA